MPMCDFYKVAQKGHTYLNKPAAFRQFLNLGTPAYGHFS